MRFQTSLNRPQRVFAPRFSSVSTEMIERYLILTFGCQRKFYEMRYYEDRMVTQVEARLSVRIAGVSPFGRTQAMEL